MCGPRRALRATGRAAASVTEQPPYRRMEQRLYRRPRAGDDYSDSGSGWGASRRCDVSRVRAIKPQVTPPAPICDKNCMGRIFETRKHTMFARWNKMSKMFTRLAKEIAIAVKSGGPIADSNPALRRVLQNCRAANMPKDKVDSAIARASGQDQQAYEIVLYEGYGPHGVPMVVETATNNPTRTVANVRMHFKDHGGNMGTTGSVAFMFQRMGVFRVK